MNPVEHLLAEIEAANIWEASRTLQRNEFLKVQGSVDTNHYYISEGCVRIFVVDQFEEHTIRFGYSGNVIAALDSFITGLPSDMYI